MLKIPRTAWYTNPGWKSKSGWMFWMGSTYGYFGHAVSKDIGKGILFKKISGKKKGFSQVVWYHPCTNGCCDDCPYSEIGPW